MKKNALLRGLTTKFWGLPLLFSLILLPVSSALSVRLWFPDGYVYLLFLPVAMMIAMLMIFDWAALPGVTIALSWHYFQRYSTLQAVIIVAAFLTTLAICWGAYRAQAGRRWRISFGELSMIKLRLFWLVFAIPSLLMVLMEVAIMSHILPVENTSLSRSPFSLESLLNYLSALLAVLATVQLCYFTLRCLRSPRFFHTLVLRCRHQFAPGVKLSECGIWLALILALFFSLTQIVITQKNLLITDYGIPLLLPLMLWSAMRFGYLFTSLFWGILVILLYHLRERFMAAGAEPYHLAVISANLFVFTLTILLMSAISSRQRRLLAKARGLAMTDPVIGLPNLRALSLRLAQNPSSALCYLRIPDLDRLSRTHGLQLRIHYKRNLARHLRPYLLAGEEIYQLPGFDMALRLDYRGRHLRIEGLEARLKEYQLNWDGVPIHPDVGISYCSVNAPVLHLYELLGEMSAMAELSLSSGHAENLQQRPNVSVQRQITEKLEMLQDIQLALQNGGFRLMAQKIRGVRGDDYYEILLRMVNLQGEHIKPAAFMPVVNEFGLTWEVDNLVLDQTLNFIDRHRERLPGVRVSINLFAETLCRPQLVDEVMARLARYNIEPWQLIIEVQESPILSNYSWGNRSIVRLRQMGCRIAIDDFGTGYASYSRLKQIQVDILKIDGSFVRNMLESSLDYQIIESICVIARLKRMQIVAEYVETEETASALRKLGVDYLQGFIIGTPFPLAELISAPAEIGQA